MNGPFLPDPTPAQPDRMRATYCLVILDDDSRRIMAGQLAWSADTDLREALLRQALERWGAPRRLYCDNGQIYVSRRLEGILARLDIRLIHTLAYTPHSGHGPRPPGFPRPPCRPPLRWSGSILILTPSWQRPPTSPARLWTWHSIGCLPAAWNFRRGFSKACFASG